MKFGLQKKLKNSFLPVRREVINVPKIWVAKIIQLFLKNYSKN